MTLGVLLVLAMLFVMFAGFWTDWLWYRSAAYGSVFTKTLWTKVGMFAVFGLLMGGAVGFNVWLAHRLRPPLSAMSLEQQSLDRYRMGLAPYKKWVLLGLTALVALISGASAAGQWRTWLMFVNASSFGKTDPQFHKDISFYTFDLPFYRFLLSFGFAAAVLSLLAAALVHYLYGGLRITTPGARATGQATGHLSALLGIFVALKAVAYWLDRYGLAVKSSGLKATDNWTGLKYVDAHAYLPAKTILFCIAIICALLFFATLWRRTWQLPVIGFGLMVLSAILIGGLYPAIVQQFQVKANELTKEAPYIKKNMKETRDAYDIGASRSQVSDYRGVSKADSNELRDAADTTASIRLLDPNIVSPAFQQKQGLRGYYQFPAKLDVDRYKSKDGKDRDTVVGLREINSRGIPEKNWMNEHFKYTHGYGMVAAKSASTDEGDPDFTEKDLPPKGSLGSYKGRIYYGEKTTKYSIVGGPQKELDYADSSGEKSYSYRGNSGVSLSSPLNRAAFAVSFNEPKILYSGAIGKGSRILYNRTPKQRVEAAAPWLTIDGDPYPAVVNGRVKWIVDGYTTSNGYPYSSRTTLGDTTADSQTNGQRSVVARQNRVNYIRNSVKATVDAYTGKVDMYQWDKKDPVLKTWMKAFPGTVQPKSRISDQLMDHLRYPQDLFKVQRQLLTRYHVSKPSQFYSASERWQVPDDPTRSGKNAVPPYYQSLRMPDQKERQFSLTSTFNPNGQKTLGAFMSVDADPRSAEYGKIRMLRLPTNTTVPGPSQVQSKINQDPDIANSLNILKKGDSKIEYGNLLTVPVENGLLWVEPVYVRGVGTNYPRMEKVAVAFGDRIAFEDTLTQALNKVFKTPGRSGQDGGGEAPPAKDQAAAQKALQDAQSAYDAGQRALNKKPQDWDAYGKAQRDLRDALKRASDAKEKGKAKEKQ